jgi:hypothetical protein
VLLTLFLYWSLRYGAAAEFQKILNHRSLVGSCEAGALSRLGIACAFALQDDSEKSQSRLSGILNSVEAR